MSDTDDKSNHPPSESTVPFDREEETTRDVISSIDPEQKEKYLEETSQEADSPPEAEAETRKQRPTDQGAQPSPILSLLSKSLEPQKRFKLQGARCVIGRKNSDLPLKDPFVSDWHAQLYFTEGALKVQDMNSKNGVYVRIADQLELEHGDEIIVGQQRFEFRKHFERGDSSERPHRLGAPKPSEPRPRLLSYSIGGDISNIYYLHQGSTLGQSNADIVIPQDEWLDTPHLSFEGRKDSVVIKDLDTQAGTFIRIHNPMELIDGDCILIGQTRIQVEFPSS